MIGEGYLDPDTLQIREGGAQVLLDPGRDDSKDRLPDHAEHLGNFGRLQALVAAYISRGNLESVGGPHCINHQTQQQCQPGGGPTRAQAGEIDGRCTDSGATQAENRIEAGSAWIFHHAPSGYFPAAGTAPRAFDGNREAHHTASGGGLGVHTEGRALGSPTGGSRIQGAALEFAQRGGRNRVGLAGQEDRGGCVGLPGGLGGLFLG